jgi:hypothetical protein
VSDSDESVDAGRNMATGVGWRPQEHAEQLKEWKQIFAAVKALSDEDATALEAAIVALDWVLAKRTRQQAGNRHPDLSPTDFTKIAVMFALTERPLAAWPQEILPEVLRMPQPAPNPSPSTERH